MFLAIKKAIIALLVMLLKIVCFHYRFLLSFCQMPVKNCIKMGCFQPLLKQDDENGHCPHTRFITNVVLIKNLCLTPHKKNVIYIYICKTPLLDSDMIYFFLSKHLL